jgi:hypothetical protein
MTVRAVVNWRCQLETPIFHLPISSTTQQQPQRSSSSCDSSSSSSSSSSRVGRKDAKTLWGPAKTCSEKGYYLLTSEKRGQIDHTCLRDAMTDELL